jgi:formylglycine-generating enzyme required for sulfatase activity
MTIKNLLSFLFIILFLSGCITFSDRKIKYFVITPISDTAYFDRTEVDVASWLSYYSWKLKHEGVEAARKVLPDSAAVEPEVWIYLNHPADDSLNMLANYSSLSPGYFCKTCNDFIQYDKIHEQGWCPFLDFPITGVTYEQVTEFCKWRTAIQGKGELVYRLPTNEEWVDFAARGLSEKERTNRMCDSLSDKCKLFNYRLDNVECNLSKYGVKQFRNSSFRPNKFMAWDVFGSVSEMTATKGESKGGNYRIAAIEGRIDSTQHYTKPEVWLGFRCISYKIK